ncbi:MAG: recombination regulator RecX [Pseudomonadota bacterium]
MKSKPEPGDLRERALRLLARREHSRFELARKLGQAGFAPDEIEPLLDEFEEKKWLSDRRFAESYIADHRARAGSIKLAYDLRQRGVSETVIEGVLRENRDTELERARQIWQKKFSSAPADSAEKARQTRFMQSKGFTSEVIQLILGAKAGE